MASTTALGKDKRGFLDAAMLYPGDMPSTEHSFHRRQYKMATAEVGMPAPDFKLAATGKQEITLSQYRGSKNVILAFYPLDWSPG